MGWPRGYVHVCVFRSFLGARCFAVTRAGFQFTGGQSLFQPFTGGQFSGGQCLFLRPLVRQLVASFLAASIVFCVLVGCQFSG